MKFVGGAVLGLLLCAGLIITIESIDSDKLNYNEIRIPAVNLKNLDDRNADPYFLVLSPAYDHTWAFSKDRITLSPSVWNDHLDTRISTEDIAEPFVETERNTRTLGRVTMSEFTFSKPFIQHLLEIPDVSYFLLTPQYCTIDRQFVAYQIGAFDEHDNKIDIPDANLRMINPCPPARPPF